MIKKLLFLVFILPVLETCQNKKKDIRVQQIETSQQVVIRMKYDKNMKKKRVSTIQFPFELKVTNSLYENGKIKRFAYLYLPLDKNSADRRAKIYSVDNDKLHLINRFLDDIVINDKERTFLIYTNHSLTDTINYNENYFASYLKEMERKNIDTLLMGTLPEFKRSHPKLTESLLSEDEIVLTFDKKVEPVTYPTGEKDTLLLQIRQPIKF